MLFFITLVRQVIKTMQMILGLIFAAIFVYVGVNLEPGLNQTVATITTPTYSSGVAGLNGVIMIVFAAMIIFGVVKQMSAAA